MEAKPESAPPFMSDSAPHPNLLIRRMTAADLDLVIDLAATLKEAPQWPPTVYATAVDPSQTPPRIALIAEEFPSETLLGFAVALVLAPESELESIVVAAAGQRRGMGRRLFAALAAELSEAGATSVHLEVRLSNSPALAFYSALGFEQMGRRPHYYAAPEEDALLLRLQLP
jgi:ribosomal-protein-alanine N-acetyltransferase